VLITERYRQSLLSAGHNAVYVEDGDTEDIVVASALTESTRAEATRGLSKAFSTVPAALAARESFPYRALEELERIALIIAGEIAASGQSVVALNDLAAADAYTLQHSVDVCAIGLMIAKKLFDREGRVDFRGKRTYDKLEHWLAKLGVGLMLHDVGKLAIPSEVLNKPGRLTPDEWKLMHEHPLIGLQMLSSDTISPLVKSVVRAHHERWDGAGYPHGLEGSNIPHFARIAAVADVFDAVTSERPYKEAAPQHVGHRIINEGSGTQFDPAIVSYFNKVVAPWPPGDSIDLADGSSGVVVSCPQADLGKPLVRVTKGPDGEPVKPYEVNLLERPALLVGTHVPAAA
jgi:HD-GYP domain-containing protein (c-di-GMP phosphodiesterase class II)